MSDPKARTEPTATVLMAVHNGQGFVSEAVESVLAQTFPDFELLIVDDASTDSTPAILTSFTDPRVRILTNSTNLGLTRSLNRGLGEARGEFIARLDHDDRAAPARLEKQLAFLRAHPDYVAVGCWLEVRAQAREGRLMERAVDDLAIRWKLLFDTALPHPSLTMRTSALRAVGGYDESFAATMDYDLECRLSRLGKLHNLPEPLVIYREHAGQMTSTRGSEQLANRKQISRREMGLLLGTDAVSEPQRAHAETVLRGRLPSPEQLSEAIAFSLRLARTFRDVYDCPDFVSSVLSQPFSGHAKATVPCLANAELKQAALHAHAALRLISSGLIRQPLLKVARAAVPTRFYRSSRRPRAGPQLIQEV